MGVDGERGGEEEGRWDELLLSEVLVSEVLALEAWSRKPGGDEVSGSG